MPSSRQKRADHRILVVLAGNDYPQINACLGHYARQYLLDAIFQPSVHHCCLLANRKYSWPLGKNWVKKKGKGDGKQESIHKDKILNRQDTSSLLKITAATGNLGSSREVCIGLSLPFAELIKSIQQHPCGEGKTNQ